MDYMVRTVVVVSVMRVHVTKEQGLFYGVVEPQGRGGGRGDCIGCPDSCLIQNHFILFNFFNSFLFLP